MTILQIRRYVRAIIANYRLKHTKNIDRKVNLFWEYKNEYHYFKPHAGHIMCDNTSCIL